MTIQEIIFLVFSSGLLLFIISGIIWCRHAEKKDWNGGYCPRCGKRWRYFDKDSQGGRGYTCDNCNNYTWISYNIDK